MSPTFRALGPDQDLYPLAAWAFHHADELPPVDRRGLFVALERAWPLRGRRKSRLTRGTFVAALVAAGVPKSRIAQHYCLSPGEVSDLERDARKAARQSFHDPPRIDADPPGAVPFDPSTQYGAVMSSKPDGGENWQRAEELLGDS